MRLSLLLALVSCSGVLYAAESEPKIYRDHVEPVWLGDTFFWYRNELPGETREFVLVDAGAAERRPAFDHTRAAAVLGRLLGRTIAPDRLPVECLEFAPARDAVILHGREQSWRLDLGTYEVREARGAAATLPVSREAPRERDAPLVLINRTDSSLTVHQFDSSNVHRPARDLGKDSRWQTRSRPTDLWLITTPTGRTRAVLRGVASPLTVIIRSDDVALLPELAAESPAPVSVRSPDGQWEAIVREHNLWLRATQREESLPLSFDGSPGDSFHHDTARDRLIRMQYDRPESPETLPDIVWSPDSRYLVAWQTRRVPDRRVHLIESSPRDQLQPRLSSYPYLKPGDEIPTRRPRLFDVSRQAEIPLATALFSQPWDLTRLHWTPDSREFTFLYNQRGHQVLRLVAIEAATGSARTVVEERSDTFVFYSGSSSYQEQLDRTREVLWSSERSGWNHLYLFDAATGRLKNAVTSGEWVVRSVERVDREKREVWFLAGGVVPGQDPYYLQLCRTGLDGTGFAVLTAGDGTHDLRWSPRRGFFLDRWSRIDSPPVTELRRARDGTLVCTLETADASEWLARRRRWPERFTAKGRDGRTDIHGVILRPPDFDPARKYPVVERVYAGPHGAFTPKACGFHDPLVDRGFIVVQADGMGTAGRGKAFHDVCWKNLADAGFPDRIAWLRAAAAAHPEIDLSRVGIYGTSAGGQTALGALLWHGDFYHAAAADCGCHDNRMDKIWWNEQWMGWPVGPHYTANSNVTHAHLLRGRLFLAVGELDRNVDPASTYQVADALVRADKDFEYLVMPGAGHGVFRTPYGRKRMEDFFVRTLRPAP